jgi:hypothetical protein
VGVSWKNRDTLKMEGDLGSFLIFMLAVGLVAVL